jgi:hypothetical protein
VCGVRYRLVLLVSAFKSFGWRCGLAGGRVGVAVRSFVRCLFVTTQVFLRSCNRQQQKRAKPLLGTTGVPTFFHFYLEEGEADISYSPRLP